MIKLISLIVSIAAGAAARKTLDVVWRKSTGHEPPKNAGDLNDSLPGVLVFSLVTAATGAVINVLTKRIAKRAQLRADSSIS